MAYQNVGTPMFYINTLEWLASTGIISLPGLQNVFRTLPVDPSANFSNPQLPENGIDYVTVPPESIPLLTSDMDKFIFILGHNLKARGVVDVALEGADYTEGTINTLVINFNGFSLLRYAGDLEKLLFNWSNIGSIVIGNTYAMPHSPDLSLTMSREMDGIERIRTRGGSDLVNYKYKRSPNWGDAAPWELYLLEYDLTLHNLARYGRRTWDLSFSYLDDGDVFGPNQRVGHLTDPDIDSSNVYLPELLTYEANSSDYDSVAGGADIDDTSSYEGSSVTAGFTTNLLTDDNFFSQVIHKTNGGQLPFIFQPNQSDPTVLAICKFDMNKFSFEQVANGVYNVRLKIREVW